MKLAALQTLIAAGESQTLEFKTSFDKASIESLVAFANSQGGTVLIGVTDVIPGTSPVIPGSTRDPRIADQVRNDKPGARNDNI